MKLSTIICSGFDKINGVFGVLIAGVLKSFLNFPASFVGVRRTSLATAPAANAITRVMLVEVEAAGVVGKLLVDADGQEPFNKAVILENLGSFDVDITRLVIEQTGTDPLITSHSFVFHFFSSAADYRHNNQRLFPTTR